MTKADLIVKYKERGDVIEILQAKQHRLEVSLDEVSTLKDKAEKQVTLLTRQKKYHSDAHVSIESDRDALMKKLKANKVELASKVDSLHYLRVSLLQYNKKGWWHRLFNQAPTI